MNRRLVLAILIVLFPSSAHGMRVLVRWDLETAPRHGLLPGISGLAVPWGPGQPELVKAAAAAGYRVHYLVSPGDLRAALPGLRDSGVAGVVIIDDDWKKALQVEPLARSQLPPSTEVAIGWRTGHFPRILANSVTSVNGSVQVAAASSQPWIESNQAAAEILKYAHPGKSFLHYSWPEDAGHPASVADYLLAVAEAGACRTDLILPLAKDFQQSLLLGRPESANWWNQIAASIKAYSTDELEAYREPDNVAVITEDFETSYELLNLLSRYNVPFRLTPRRELKSLSSPSLALVLFLAKPYPAEIRVLDRLLAQGVSVILGLENRERIDWPRKTTTLYENEDSATFRVGNSQLVEIYGLGFDPSAVALDVRRMLGRERRPIQLSNALTVIGNVYRDGESRLVLYLTNYALEGQVVQARVPGTFSKVQCVWPDKSDVATGKLQG